MVARVWAVAVVACAGPRVLRLRRENAPRALGRVRRRWAAMRRARLARVWTRRLPGDRTGPPRLWGSGQRPRQEAQGLSVGHGGLLRPPAARMRGIVRAWNPGTGGRSPPVSRERGVRRAQAGSWRWGGRWAVVGGGQ